MAPPRIPPTRFGPAAAQPAGRPAMRRLPPAPPPTRFGPSPALLRKLAPSPAARGAGVIQRMESTTLDSGKKTETPKKPCASCTMGQGLAGELDEVILHSTGFSTCSPIVMFNLATRRGGLFHFAAGNLETQAAALKQMFRDVQPTELHIPDRQVARDAEGRALVDGLTPMDKHLDDSDLREDDRTVLEGFFKEACNFKRPMNTTPRGETYYVTANASGRLVISPGLSPEPMCDFVDYANTKNPTFLPEAATGLAGIALFGRNMYKEIK